MSTRDVSRCYTMPSTAPRKRERRINHSPDQPPLAGGVAGSAAFFGCCFLALCAALLVASLEVSLASLFIASLEDFMASELDFIASLLASVADCGGVVLCAITGDMARPKTTAVARASTA